MIWLGTGQVWRGLPLRDPTRPRRAALSASSAPARGGPRSASPTKLDHYLWLILIVAMVVRVVGIRYGLPLDVVADESSLIFGAVAMLQLKTLIPALDPAGFAHLRYPPLIPYLNLLVFVPVLLVQYLAGGFGSVAAFKEHLVTHPESYWIPARLLQAAFGTATVWLVYKIGRLLAGQRAGWCAAAFLALSFNHVVLSHLAKQWILIVLFMMWVLYLGLAWPLRMTQVAVIGLLCGLAFGSNVIGLLVWTVFAGALAYRERRRGLRVMFDRRLWICAAICVAVAGLFIALHWPYFVWLFTKGMGSNVTWLNPKSGGGYLTSFAFAAKVLLNQELMICVFSVIGAWLLCSRRQYAPVIGMLAWIVGYVTFLYTSAYMAERFLVLLIPPLCLLAGFGLHEVWSGLAPRRPGLAKALLACVALISAVPVARVDWLLTRKDTRLLAKEWLEAQAGGAVWILSSGSQGVQVQRNHAALVVQREYGRLGLGESARLAKLERSPDADGGLFAVNVQDWEPSHQRLDSVAACVARYGGSGRSVYFVVTYTAPDRLSDLDRALIRQGTLVKRFDTGFSDQMAVGDHFTAPVTVLFQVARLGAIVEIYELPHPTHALAGGAIGERP